MCIIVLKNMSIGPLSQLLVFVILFQSVVSFDRFPAVHKIMFMLHNSVVIHDPWLHAIL